MRQNRQSAGIDGSGCDHGQRDAQSARRGVDRADLPDDAVRRLAVDGRPADGHDGVLEVDRIAGSRRDRHLGRGPPRARPIGRRAAASPPGRGSPSRGRAVRTPRAHPRPPPAARRRAPSSCARPPGPPCASPGVPGRAEYRKTWRPARSMRPDEREASPNASSSSVGKPAMTSAWTATPGDGRACPLDDPGIVGGQVPAAHASQHAVVARLERQVQVRQRPRRAVDPRREQLVVDVLGLDGAEAEALDRSSRPGSAGRGRRA